MLFRSGVKKMWIKLLLFVSQLLVFPPHFVKCDSALALSSEVSDDEGADTVGSFDTLKTMFDEDEPENVAKLTHKHRKKVVLYHIFHSSCLIVISAF